MALISRRVLVARPQELGKIKIGRLGAKKTSAAGNEFQQPVRLDHFLVTTRHRGPDGNFVLDAAVHAHPEVGPKPTQLAAHLMYETVEENFHSEMQQYKGKKQIVRCNGEVRTDLLTDKCMTCPLAEGKECPCKPYSRLAVQLWASPDTLGFHVYRSTSWETANNLQTALESIRETCDTLYRAPVILKVYPSEDHYTEKGVDKTGTSHKVGLVLAMSMEETMRTMIDSGRRLELGRTVLRQLAAGVAQDLVARDTEEAADIADEFFPPADAAVAATSIASQATLERMKADLGVGNEANAPTVEGDFEIEEPAPPAAAPATPPVPAPTPAPAPAPTPTPTPAPTPPPVVEDPVIATLVEYLGHALDAVGHLLSEKVVASIQRAVGGRERDQLLMGREFVDSRLKDKPWAVLMIRRVQARAHDLLDAQSEQDIEDVLTRSGDTAGVEMWVKELDNRLDKRNPLQPALPF